MQPTRFLCPWGFSRQECWSGLSCPPPGDLSNPGIELKSPTLQADSLPSELPGKPKNTGVDSLSLHQGIFLTQELNQGLLHCRRPRFDYWVRKIHWRRDRLPIPVFLGFPCGSAGKESTCNAEDPGSILGSRRSPGEGIDYPFQYSWASLVAQMVKNPPARRETWVQSLGWEDPLEEGMATYSSILAW